MEFLISLYLISTAQIRKIFGGKQKLKKVTSRAAYKRNEAQQNKGAFSLHTLTYFHARRRA